jgi:hypothetical protein
MQIKMEVFYLRIVENTVWYRRTQVNLDSKSRDPNALIQSLIQQNADASAKEAREEFVVHSTSWRYIAQGTVMLTYIAYSDELEFGRGKGRGKVKKLTLKQLKQINVSRGTPRSKAGLERQIVAHAMRHISFLIKTDYAKQFKEAFTPKTRRIFKSLWSTLAGRVAF